MAKQLYKYAVTVNGKTFTRGSNRVYTHALVAQRSYQKALAEAQQWTTRDEDYLVRTDIPFWSFPFWSSIADGSYWVKHNFTKRDDENTRHEIAEGQRIVALGLDAYRQECKDKKIALVEKRREQGDFKVAVISWHGSEKNAKSAAGTHYNRGYYTKLQVVPVGSEILFEEIA